MADFLGIDWDPSHSPIFRTGVAFNEVAALGATYLISPSLTAHLSQEFASINTANGIANLPGIESLDPRLSPVAIEVVVPTMELVAEAAAVYGGTLLGNVILPGYGGYYGAAIAGTGGGLALKYLEGQSGIPQGKGGYAKWAIYVGAAAGAALGWNALNEKQKAADPVNDPTPSPSADSGYNPGYGPTAKTQTSLEKLQSAVGTYKPYFDVASQIYGAAKPFLSPGASTSHPGGNTGTPGAAGPQPVNMAGMGLAAVLIVLAVRKIQQ